MFELKKSSSAIKSDRPIDIVGCMTILGFIISSSPKRKKHILTKLNEAR